MRQGGRDRDEPCGWANGWFGLATRLWDRVPEVPTPAVATRLQDGLCDHLIVQQPAAHVAVVDSRVAERYVAGICEGTDGLRLAQCTNSGAPIAPLVRTNRYASNASSSFTAHAVGCGIKPSSLVEDGTLKDQIQRLWLVWTDEADADG